MIKHFTITLFFLLATKILVNAGCAGPKLQSNRGGYCPNGIISYPINNADTVLTSIGQNDSIVLTLQANSDCDFMDSVEWYKDGTLLRTMSYSGQFYQYTVAGPGIYTCKFRYGGIPIIYSLLFSTATAVFDASQDSPDISVYPNPSNGIYILDVKGDSDSFIITVSDISGCIIKTLQENEKNITIDISNYSPGFYSLSYTDNKGRRRIKKLIYN